MADTNAATRNHGIKLTLDMLLLYVSTLNMMS